MDSENITAKVFRSNQQYLDIRCQRIDEALSFASGTQNSPQKHLISVLPNGKEAYYLKPGKEAFRENPNVHDMSVWVGDKFEGYTLEDIWAYLVEISIINQLLFKQILVLLYRLCYFIDHRLDEYDKIRYLPSDNILAHIEKMDYAIRLGFEDKFKKNEVGIFEYLHFIDLLGWNEDVKYQSNYKKDFSRKNTGRPNTIMSVISVPLLINEFVSNIIENAKDVGKINVRLILTAMQNLSRSRGVCVLSHAKLQEYLYPYLER